MHTPSIRTLAAIAYERGEEFDPALMLSPALAESLQSAAQSAAPSGVMTGGVVLTATAPRPAGSRATSPAAGS